MVTIVLMSPTEKFCDREDLNLVEQHFIMSPSYDREGSTNGRDVSSCRI